MKSSKNLNNLRKRIDSIDEKILDLINRRGKIALDISEHKQQNSLKVYDPGREKEIEIKNSCV